MAPDSWSDADSVSQASQHSQMSNQDTSLDRQLIRHLMQRYGRDGIAQLINEEANSSSISINDGASVVTSSTFSSVKSEETPSIFDKASIRTFSSDNSSTRGSIISNVSARTAKLLGRKQAARPSITHEEETSPASNESSTPAPKQKGSFTCGFCREEGIQKTCTRKNDLKRHIEDFHNTNAQWFCRQKGCDMVFDWQTAYKTHLKQAHGGSRMALDEAKVNLCPQTVFACGFENCSQVFESPNDDEADTIFKEFVAHVVKHFDEGSNSGEWTYSARIRNLLRQSGLVRAWQGTSWGEDERSQLQWHPQSSGILRKRLETRHLGDLQLLVQYAIALGTEPSSIKEYREDFINPLKDQCRQYNMASAPMYDPRQQQQFAMMQQASGGIIAEDLRSFQSIAGNVPEQDIDMQDTDMMDSTFMSSPSFSGPYGPQGITTAADGACITSTDPMNPHIQFGFDSTYT
ncbi:Uncharacterized protein Y057_224 [Fusarium fujikuroi]|nr:Uncharacterized protein Y057_224 [Fusarium fujikuroi]